jgi:hypothetical protein
LGSLETSEVLISISVSSLDHNEADKCASRRRKHAAPLR